MFQSLATTILIKIKVFSIVKQIFCFYNILLSKSCLKVLNVGSVKSVSLFSHIIFYVYTIYLYIVIEQFFFNQFFSFFLFRVSSLSI